MGFPAEQWPLPERGCTYVNSHVVLNKAVRVDLFLTVSPVLSVVPSIQNVAGMEKKTMTAKKWLNTYNLNFPVIP